MNHYQTLGVSRQASTEKIKQAFRTLAKKYHPDTSSAKDSEKFRSIKAAYDVLSDVRARAAYDCTLPPESKYEEPPEEAEPTPEEIELDKRVDSLLQEMFMAFVRETIKNVAGKDLDRYFMYKSPIPVMEEKLRKQKDELFEKLTVARDRLRHLENMSIFYSTDIRNFSSSPFVDMMVEEIIKAQEEVEKLREPYEVCRLALGKVAKYTPPPKPQPQYTQQRYGTSSNYHGDPQYHDGKRWWSGDQ